jgi:hypothetical protein
VYRAIDLRIGPRREATYQSMASTPSDHCLSFAIVKAITTFAPNCIVNVGFPAPIMNKNIYRVYIPHFQLCTKYTYYTPNPSQHH